MSGLSKWWGKVSGKDAAKEAQEALDQASVTWEEIQNKLMQ